MNRFVDAINRRDEQLFRALLSEPDDGNTTNRHSELAVALGMLTGDRQPLWYRWYSVCGGKLERDLLCRTRKLNENVLTADKLKFAEMLFLAGVDPNTKSEECDNQPLLTYTVCNQDLAMMRLFINFGCDVNACDRRGITALHNAVLGPSTFVSLLLKSDADPNLQVEDGCTPLTFACARCDSYAVNGVLDLEVIDLLLVETQVNLGDEYGLTALHHASLLSNKNNPVFHKLLTCDRVDINARDERNSTPLMKAVKWLPVDRIADKKPDCPNALEDVIKSLIERGCDVTCRDDAGNTALHKIVAHLTETSLLHLLIIAGADVNAPNLEGFTPLYLAAKAGKEDHVLSLLQHNADVPPTYKTDQIEPLHLIDQGCCIMAMLILAGHNWDYSTANYTKPRQFCFCGGPNPPDFSKILTGDIKINYDQRCAFVQS